MEARLLPMPRSRNVVVATCPLDHGRTLGSEAGASSAGVARGTGAASHGTVRRLGDHGPETPIIEGRTIMGRMGCLLTLLFLAAAPLAYAAEVHPGDQVRLAVWDQISDHCPVLVELWLQ